MSYEIRNATYRDAGNTIIDLEWNSPSLGWIPFTARADDGEQHGQEIFAQAAAGTVAPYVAPVMDAAAYARIVDAERDRRLAEPFLFEGKEYARDAKSLARITGAGALAVAAIADGALPDGLTWAGGAEGFGWIAEDNTVTPMDAQTMLAFATAAAAVERHLVFMARALKDSFDPDNLIDPTLDQYWT